MDSFSKIFLIGGIAAVPMWFFSYPIDVVKSKLQVFNNSPDTLRLYLTHSKRRSLRKATLKLYRKEGLRGYYKGLTPCLLRSFPVGGVSMVVYEGLY